MFYPSFFKSKCDAPREEHVYTNLRLNDGSKFREASLLMLPAPDDPGVERVTYEIRPLPPLAAAMPRESRIACSASPAIALLVRQRGS